MASKREQNHVEARQSSSPGRRAHPPARPADGSGGSRVVAASQLGFPAVVRAQEAVKIGHLTPLTGFLGQLGEYAP